MYKTKDLRIELDDDFVKIKERIARKMKVSMNDIVKYEFARKSIDARDKNDIFFICSFYLWLKDSFVIPNNDFLTLMDEKSIYATLPVKNILLEHRPVVIGFGPCGMFIGLYLAKLGCRPIIIERGRSVEMRAKDIDDFFRTGKINPDSNVQFGEGGAGTFSDGKLSTNNKDEKIKVVINELIEYGAPKTIFYDNKPHIGTDKLIGVVKNIRQKIISLGGEIFFEHTFIDFKQINGHISEVTIQNKNGIMTLPCQDLFLACGHSARDTFAMLYKNQISIKQKPFAVGVRIEHLQSMINQSQYGRFYQHPNLKAADYKLVTQLDNQRTVYTFCMCPGGVVINASSEEGGICCNGMSYYSRDGINANSALLVSVGPQDYPSDHPLAGLEFQKKIEQAAYHYSNTHSLVVQTVGNFLHAKPNVIQEVKPSCRSSYVMGNINELLPKFIIDSLKLALPIFDRKIKGFAGDENLLIGVEARSSSPIRIERKLDYSSLSLNGFYPCGEGAGYAGGIITSAIDGIKCVETVMQNVYNIDL